MMKKLLILSTIFVLAGLACADTTTGLVGWWKMDETMGTAVADSSGNGCDGYFDGSLAWASGSLDFTGGKVLFDTADVQAAFSTIDRQVTISFWVNLDNEAKRCDMYYLGTASTTDSVNNHIEIGGMNGADTWCYVGEGGNLLIEWGTNIADNDNYVGYQGNWRLVTLVKDADGGELTDPNDPNSPLTGISKLYINGVVVASATANPSWINSNYMNYGIAGDGLDSFQIGGGGSPIDGKVKDFRVYDRALTDADVLELAGTACDEPQCLYPADGQGSGEFDILLGVKKLHWMHGARAASHNIYLGTNKNAVTNGTTASAEFLGNVVGTVYEGDVNNPFDINTPDTYYWKVDAIGSDSTVWSSEVISFTIDGPPVAVEPLAWWKMDQTSGSTVLDYSGNGYNAEKHSSIVWENDGRYGNLHFTADYVPTQVLVDVNTSTEMFSHVDDQLTIAFWVKSESTSPSGDTHWLYKGSAIGTPGTSTYGSIYCEYPSYDAGWWHMGRGDKMTHYGSYFNFIHDWTHWIISKNTNTGLMKLYKNGTLVMTSTNKTQSMSGVTYWSIGCGTNITQWRWFNGNMRDFRLYNKELPDFQIEELPGEYVYVAKKPSPADDAENVEYDALLSWEAGKNAVAHDVYFGESFNAVKNADVTSPLYKGQFAANSYDPNELPLLKTYYWRVDEIDDEDVVHKGDVWGFSTIPYVMVEDFESYDEEGNDVTAVWVDALDYSDMQRLLATEPGYPVLSPVNSLRLRYHALLWSPASYYTIAGRTFSPAQDWTVKGVKMLTIHYYGDAGNQGLPMFITVGDGTTDANVVVDVNTLAESWNQANVSLPEIAAAGVDLTKVSYMEIGFGDGTDQGMSSGQYDTLYIDDIALYPSKCVLSESSLQADITKDCVVNYDDLAYVTDGWLRGSSVDAITAAGPVGLWTFDDSATLLKATIGNDLTTGNYNGTGGPVTAVAGIAAGDGAALVPLNTYLNMTNTITPAPGETRVNEYTMVWDVKIPAASAYGPMRWVGLGEFDTADLTTDVDISVVYTNNRINGSFGTHQGWSPQLVEPDKWYQLAVSVKNGHFFNCYVNGELAISSPAQAVDGRYSIGNTFHIFKDNDNEDPDINCSTFALFDRALTAAEIKSLVPIQLLKGDINADTAIDFADYSILANEWLIEDLWP